MEIHVSEEIQEYGLFYLVSTRGKEIQDDTWPRV